MTASHDNIVVMTTLTTFNLTLNLNVYMEGRGPLILVVLYGGAGAPNSRSIKEKKFNNIFYFY